jgi:hypothetical protein
MHSLIPGPRIIVTKSGEIEMEHEETNQQLNKPKKNPKKTPANETHTFGERIEYDKENTSANQELTDEYGELIYREHDEFGEWLDRHQ